MVTERGTVDSLKNSTLTCKVDGTATIIRLVPEGTMVEAGEVVCELDSSSLRDKETQQRIAVTQAESLLTQARENVDIQRTQNDSDIAAAQLKLKLSEIDLRKFREGDFLQQQSELDGQKTVASENLNKALEEFDFSNRLAKKGYGTQNELEAKRIAVMKARIDLSVASDKLKVLQDFSYERQIEELEANARENVREVERVERKARAALAAKESELTSRQLTSEVETATLKRLREQIENCTLRAPQPGQVIYVNMRDGRPSDTVLIEEGATVRERQPIINLPDLDQMKVNARIHESRISLLKEGLPVTVRIDAYPGEIFNGRVESVSSVPSSTGFMRSDTKEYDAVVRLLEPPARVNKLRPGLTAGIEILVEKRDRVLLAPVQSVLAFGKRQVVFVIREGRPTRVDVKVGASNEQSVEILSGLTEGEEVVMNPRSQFARELTDLESTEKSGKRGRQGGPGAGGPGAGGPGGRPGRDQSERVEAGRAGPGRAPVEPSSPSPASNTPASTPAPANTTTTSSQSASPVTSDAQGVVPTARADTPGAGT